MKKKKIVFYPADRSVAQFSKEPIAAKRVIPDWYKQVPKYYHPDVLRDEMVTRDLSVKACIPFVDTLTSGYTILLETDISVRKDENGKTYIKWTEYDAMNSPVIQRSTYFVPEEDRARDQALLPQFDGYDKLMFNWNEFWGFKTPKGYSALSIHPINRLDLPFYTLGGIINTDKWGVNGNHPFILKRDWTGVIPAGTPIIQIIPFKRDAWKSEVDRSIYRYDGDCLEESGKVKRHYYRDNLWETPDYE